MYYISNFLTTGRTSAISSGPWEGDVPHQQSAAALYWSDVELLVCGVLSLTALCLVLVAVLLCARHCEPNLLRLILLHDRLRCALKLSA